MSAPPLPPMPKPPTPSGLPPMPPSMAPVPPPAMGVRPPSTPLRYSFNNNNVPIGGVRPPSYGSPRPPSMGAPYHPAAPAGDCPQQQCDPNGCPPPEECMVMDCTTDMQDNTGSSDRAIASQAAVARAFGAVTIAFGVIELGLGGYAYAITQKNGYYGATSNAAGAWWAGLAAVVAGTIACVHVNKESVLAAAALNYAAFGICLAGAVVDGIMTVQFWQNMATCINLNQNSTAAQWITFAISLLAVDLGQANVNTLAAPQTPLIANWFTNANQGNDLYRTYAMYCGFWSVNGPPASDLTRLTNQVNAFASQNDKQVFCVANGFDNVSANDKFLTGARMNQFCYQISVQSPLGITDVSRINVILQASVAFCVLPCATAAATAILLTWLYVWVHPADNQGGPMLVGVEPKGLQMGPPPLPALPPAPRPVVPPPYPTSNIDLKPLGQIK